MFVLKGYENKYRYYSLFNSHINYAINIWSSTTKNNLKKIQIIQKRAIKNLFKYNRDENTKRIHTENGLLPIEDTIKYFQAIQIHNIFKGLSHSNTNLLLRNDIHSHHTRNAHLINQQQNNSRNMGINSVKYRAIETYNELPETLKAELNINRYKSKLKEHIKNNYLAS